MLRIAMITQSYYTRDPRVRREAEALAEAGHHVDVICLKDKGEPYRSKVNNVDICRIPLRRVRGGFLRYVFEYLTFFLASSVCLTVLQLKRWYHIVHVHNMPNFLVFSTLFPRLCGAKIALDMHDPMPELFQSQFKLQPQHWLIRILRLEEVWSCRHAHYLLTVNESMRERLVHQGLDPKRVHVVMNLPDPRIFNPSQITRQHYQKRSHFTLIYTGTVSPRYGLDIAIEALHTLKPEMPDLQLVILGEGPHLPDLQRKGAAFGLDKQVIFMKSVSLDRIPAILAGSDVSISPHRNDAYGALMLSTKVAESLLVGLPVISARTHTMMHYFDDSEIFFFEPGDVQDFAQQVRLIRRHPDVVAAKQAAAHKKLHQLNWEVEKDKFIELVANIVTAPQRVIATDADPIPRGGDK